MLEPYRNLDQARQKYFAALGLFIQRFSETEALLASILEKKADVSPEVARALFSGVRADAAMKNITRILDVLKAPTAEKAEVQAIFSHLGVVTLIRNDIVHYGTQDYGPSTDYTITNKRVALNRSRLRLTPVSARILSDLTEDIETINARLNLYYAIGAKSEADAHEFFGPIAQRAWRYKSAPPASPGGKRRSKSRTQKPRPRSRQG